MIVDLAREAMVEIILAADSGLPVSLITVPDGAVYVSAGNFAVPVMATPYESTGREMAYIPDGALKALRAALAVKAEEHSAVIVADKNGFAVGYSAGDSAGSFGIQY